MTDRPRPGRGDAPAEGTPEYDWLYGGAGEPPADATRRLPTMPRETATRPTAAADETVPLRATVAPAAAGGGAPPPRPTARPTPPPVAPPPESRPRRKRPWRRIVTLVLVAWLAFLVAVPLWAWSKVDKVNAFPNGDRPGDQPGTTYLLVGSDSRAGLTGAERKKLGTGGATGQRTDTIMLLHIGSGPDLLMSIPRDSLVEVPGHGRTKINAAFAYGGPKLLVQTIEQDTGIHIDHYVEIGFGGFVNVVDAVGGIEICPKEAMKDPLANLDIKKGCQEADGVTALGYARSRHTSALGDIDRAQHQREVVSAVGHKAVSPWSVLNPVRYFRLNSSAADSLRISKGTGPIALGRFAWAMTHVSGKSGLTCGVPIANLSVEWDAERSQQMFDRIIKDQTDKIGKNLCSPSGLPS
ncbi:LCP family protein [Nocardioides sp.]|uniref:LCP family protein n=1 Tax=Nocardioides sp. TaxID=35761 RepID=UPI003528CFE0